jgi:hypothetical protein
MLTKAPVENAQTAEPDNVQRLIAIAAYYLAEQRGFDPGHEVDDWLQAEAEVFDRLSDRTS